MHGAVSHARTSTQRRPTGKSLSVVAPTVRGLGLTAESASSCRSATKCFQLTIRGGRLSAKCGGLIIDSRGLAPGDGDLLRIPLVSLGGPF